MKPSMAFQLFFVIVFFIMGCAEEVQFADPNFELAIRKSIEKPEGAILKSDLEGLAKLYANEKNITNLNGIEHCKNLQELVLWKNKISDISPLNSLANLQLLNLWDNQISDISPLSGLTKLKSLGLGGNQIIDTSPLGGLTNLQRLHLNRNQISDISPLLNNPGIGKGDKVSLRGNPLSDYSINNLIPKLEESGVNLSYAPTLNIASPEPGEELGIMIFDDEIVTMDELFERFKASTRLIIKAGKNVSHKQINQIMEIAKHVGIKDVIVK